MIEGTGLIVVSLIILFALLAAVNRFFKLNPNSPLSQSKGWVYSILLFFGLGVIFALLPIDGSAKSSVFSLLGLVVTAVIAISSTTFASNAMAGIMLRIIRGFKIGDFIEAGEHFGRVSELGFLHTEIQTKSRNLTTLPNIYLVSHPVTVIPSDKALIDATLSLGYDVSHHQVESILKVAAKKIDLVDVFVQVTDLGDFSVSYRVAGFLYDPKLLLTARSNLRKQVIDSLHGAGIEIVSPTFMNQRQYASDEVFVSEVKRYLEVRNKNAEKSNVFDKAEAAEEVSELKNNLLVIEKSLGEAGEIDKSVLLEQQQNIENRIVELEGILSESAVSEEKSSISHKKI
ncbi:MAG: mechanosensitive ion channel family protein [Gammaproteobacteria bacterium]|nr:mechanosensitive ion channel family protein [Gammaproteobacteria bacterium]